MKRIALFIFSAIAATCAVAHVSFEPPRAEAGTTYKGVLHAGHGCEGAPTTALDVQLPGGANRSLRPNDKGDVAVEFQVPSRPGPLWMKVVQHCGERSVNWADAPAQGTSTEGMKTPAVRLDVMSPADFAAYKMLPAVEGAWVRAAVPGQQSTGAYMRITAKEPMQLVGASTPVAAIADVHEMKMEGDVMHMRPAGTIALPAGKTLELKPGGYHLMLQDLKKPLEKGSTVPVTLVFRDARGRESRLELKLPVALQAPDAPAAGMAMEHKH